MRKLIRILISPIIFAAGSVIGAAFIIFPSGILLMLVIPYTIICAAKYGLLKLSDGESDWDFIDSIEDIWMGALLPIIIPIAVTAEWIETGKIDFEI